MSTQPLRHRKLLSASRRAGLQVDVDAAHGRASRHAQGWRDQLDAEDQLDAARGIIRTGLACGAMYVGLIAFLLFFGA